MNGFLYWPGYIPIFLAACWIGTALALTFIARYHHLTGGRWRATPEGQWTMYRRVMEAAILGLTLINFYFPGWPGSLPLSTFVLAAYALGTYVPHHLLTRAQREAHASDLEGRAEDEGSSRRDLPGSYDGAHVDR